MSIWKLSAGTACVVGKRSGKSDALPTTAYIMLGERCANNCRFCTQAKDSQAKDRMLSRITWPAFPGEEAAAAVAAAHTQGGLKRACLQVVHGRDSLEEAAAAVGELHKESSMPICASCHFTSREEGAKLFQAGADRVCLALDAATPEIYGQVKGDSIDWNRKRNLLRECAEAYPGRMTTHLIVGLGETEEEMVKAISCCLKEGITVGLFAFTPVRGTAWAERSAPDLGSYRRIQLAHHLLKQGMDLAEVEFDPSGRIIGFPVEKLRQATGIGSAFQTSGCPDCNRPYYNEKPGGVMYNYPRPLSSAEVRKALEDSGVWKDGENCEMAVG